MDSLVTWLQSADGRLEIKLAVSALGVLLCGLLWWRARRGASSRLLSLLLVGTTLASLGGYFEFGALRYERYLNPHDVYHYYIGSKYSREHRYIDLYRASLIADLDLNNERKQSPLFQGRSIRDLRTHEYESIDAVVEDGRSIRAAFSPVRWEEFKRDIQFFQDAVSPYSSSKWTEMLRDKGYNATPVWNAIARAISWRVPTSSEQANRWLPAFDLVLLAGMFALVARAFGATTTAMALLYFGVSYMMSYPHIKGGFLRLDWLVCTVAAGSLLRLGRPALAGAALAYATLSRVFPVLFALGPAVLLAESGWRALRTRGTTGAVPLRRDLVVFFLAMSLTSVALVGFSLVADEGPALWSIFLDKIALHNSDMSSNRAGFKYLYYGLVTGLEFDRATLFDHPPALYVGLCLASLIPSVLVVRRLQSWEALFVSFVPVYFLTAPTFYYFVVLVAPFLYFAARMDRAWHALGAAGLFAVSALAYSLDFTLPHDYELFFAVSAALAVVCALLWVAAWREPQGAAGDDAPPPLPAARGVRREIAGVALAVLLLGGLMLSAPKGNRGGPVQIASLAIPAAGEASLIFVGDVMFSRNVERAVRADERTWDTLFDASRAILSEADLAIANLETPVSARGAVVEKRHNFRSPPDALPALKRSGIDIVSLANNHTLDYGPEALEDTERLLGEHGLLFGGVARVGEAQRPIITEVRGLKIGTLFYCDPEPTYSCAEEFRAFERRPVEATPESLTRDIAALRPQVDVLVVVIHWGVEYRAEPSKRTRALGRQIIDLGADVVAGSHPHVQHPIERYKSGVILYSLGNFVFDQRTRPATQVSRIVRLVVGRESVRAVQFMPMGIVPEQWGPRPLVSAFLDVEQDRPSLRTWAVPPDVAP